MVEKVIVIQNKETTEDGTLIITMQPVANARWTSNSGLIEAGVAVQPYGVFMIPDAETFVATGLMADVSINQVLFSTPLSALIAGDAEDEITFAAPYLNLTDLQDVTITSPSNGQALIWDATNSKWVNGSAGGGGGGEAGYTVEKETYIPLQTVPLTREDEYTLVGTITSGDFPTENGEYYLEIDGVEDTVNYVYDAEYNWIYYGDFTLKKTGNTITVEYATADDVASIELTLYGKVITISDDFEDAVKQVSQPNILYFDPSTITDNQVILYKNAECTILADPINDVADKFNVHFVAKPIEGQPISYFTPTNIVDNGEYYTYSMVVEMSQNTFITLSFGFAYI